MVGAVERMAAAFGDCVGKLDSSAIKGMGASGRAGDGGAAYNRERKETCVYKRIEKWKNV